MSAPLTLESLDARVLALEEELRELRLLADPREGSDPIAEGAAAFKARVRAMQAGRAPGGLS